MKHSRSARSFLIAGLAVLASMPPCLAQTDPRQVGALLGEQIVSPNVSLHQIKRYLLARVAKPPAPGGAEQWNLEARRLREHLLNNVVFHGWSKEWVDSGPRFEDLGTIETGKGYRIRKLRYEIVPGFQSAALLYEPESAVRGIPAILNVNGHVGPAGKAVEYKQKRCINYAKRGIIALNLEWLGYGELTRKEDQHWFGAHLDLVGRNEIGLFYLAMRRGLDYLSEHPSVDRNRIGVTGLSGGGWQTIVLSSLDERVKVSVPVAGFSSLASRVEPRRFGDLGDIEQGATDFLDGQDFTHLVAMMAPRPTLLIYNAEDNCCFRGPIVRAPIYDAIRSIFRIYGKEDSLAWHENQDPGTHNYLEENRIQSYRFFARHFGLPAIEGEIDSDAEILAPEKLTVGLPPDNLSILGLARKLGREIVRPPIPADASGHAAWIERERSRLRRLIRYETARVARAWTVANTKNKGLETLSHHFEMDNGLDANGVWLRAIGRPENTPVSIVLNDQGKKGAGVEVSERLNRGEQVLAVDLLFNGDAWQEIPVHSYAQLVHGVGRRSIGLIAAQLVAISQWMRDRAGVTAVRLETTGFRSQVAALAASALAPGLYPEIIHREGISSLSYLLERPVEYSQAPELFCLDLYRDFDIDRLQALSTAKVVPEAASPR